MAVWNERFAEIGAHLRQRRAAFVSRLRAALRDGFRPRGEVYDVQVHPESVSQSLEEGREALLREVLRLRSAEERAGRTLVGPHRDTVLLTVDGEDAGQAASSGQARCLLLALVVATLALHREERGEPAVALLDDLDSELDEERARALCQEVTAGGQALVTTAHPGWAERLRPLGRLFRIEEGEVRAA
jgi:DNA replication and repair protein RecF